MANRMHFCFFCGEELGVYSSAWADPLDHCGKSECAREAQNSAIQERDEAHEQLDRDMGW